MTVVQRILARCTPVGDCLVWQGGQARGGYGKTWYQGRTVVAHRALWLASGREIPEGLTLDHLCRNRLCVNPDHLEPVTIGDNWRRAVALITHCPQGHEYAGDNLYRHQGRRHCKECRREQLRASRRRRREQAA